MVELMEDDRRRIRVRPRRSAPRAFTVPQKTSDERARQRLRLTYQDVIDAESIEKMYDRPRTRGECRDAVRPCPWVSCEHHLYLDVDPFTGSLKLNFPTLEPWELTETCSVDVGDSGPQTLEVVGELMNVTRERCRQIEVKGLLAMKTGPALVEIGAEVTAFPEPVGNEIKED